MSNILTNVGSGDKSFDKNVLLMKCGVVDNSYCVEEFLNYGFYSF